MKKWPAVARYFVETTLKYFFNSTPEEIISHFRYAFVLAFYSIYFWVILGHTELCLCFRSLLYLSLTDNLQCMSVQPVEESQKKYLAVMLW